ncbi:hypothetical protein H4R34_002782 [Dimargaris verticillata]|uniref:Uncharacterized protein n=1 Tax=Dimargaris verticillata TaxID=2761393 RepID=A0A9W8ECL8_9FUNG|nr:hypothetical protein H4R34_002782 [Dimargaris verticillata]
MDLQAILPTNHKFYSAAAIALGPELQVIGAQYLEDPTVPEEEKQRYRSLQQTDSLASPAMFNGYFWQHLKFRWDHDLFSIPWGENPSQNHITADVVLDHLRDDIIILSRTYLRFAPDLVEAFANPEPIPLDSVPHPDLFLVHPLLQQTNFYHLYMTLLSSTASNGFEAFTSITKDPLGAFNKGYVADIPALVEKYLEVINNDNLCLSLQARQHDPVYATLAPHITRNDPDRTRYFFNDIMGFQVIPRLIMAHVAMGYFKQALVFIDRMLNNPYLVSLWQSIEADTGLNYYELAAYAALSADQSDKTFVFVATMKEQPGFRINRLTQCLGEGYYSPPTIAKLKEAIGEELLFAPISDSGCGRFRGLFQRGQYYADTLVVESFQS